MVADKSESVAWQAEALYEQKFRAQFEAKEHGKFVAIEPESGQCFLGRTLDDAINAARAAFPDRLPYVKRVGFRAAVELGNHQ